MTAIDYLVSAPGYPSFSEGFLLDEDNALRKHLMGMTVSDSGSPERPVGVWYSHPDVEIRDQRYPYMTISLADVSEASNRVHSGRVEVAGVPLSMLEDAGITPVIANGQVYNGSGLWNDVWMDSPSFPLKFYGNAPIPVQLDYLIRAYSRNPRHDRMIIHQMFASKIAFRYSHMDMSGIDSSVRRLELLDFTQGDVVEENKRTFISAFTIRVDSWLPYGPEQIDIVEASVVTSVQGTVRPSDNGNWTAAAFGTSARWTSLDTGVLDPGESWDGYLDMTGEFTVRQVASNAPCRVRVYRSAEDLAADSSRPYGDSPASTIDVLMDIQTSDGWLIVDAEVRARSSEGVYVSVHNVGDTAADVAAGFAWTT